LDYHLTYLKCDVLLLADVFENFRSTCIKYYKLDPANYISIPGLAWDALLYKTKIELDLISDVSILNMMEDMKRGGLCFVGSKRHVVANNKYLPNHDTTKPESFLMYWDCNNLYGKAMCDLLPYKNLRYSNETLEQILLTPDDAEEGYIIRCNIKYPKHLHNKFRQFPPCPENLVPDIEWFSDYQKMVGEKTNIIKNGKFKGTPKLIPHLFEHKNYVLHYKNLKFIKDLGVEIEMVGQPLKFEQKAWMEPYITFNTNMRKEAKNDFEKDFFKLMNNAVFGKTMENVKNRIDIHPTTNNKNAIKWFSKSHFKQSKCINGLHLIEMFKKEIVYDKPLYVGSTILDLSKLCMMDFHYNVIHKNFDGKYELVYSDTDSLIYHIFHDDIYEWSKENKEYFDFSDSLRPDLQDDTNKKVLGKFKDEINSLPIQEVTALNPKVYSIVHQNLKKDIQKKINKKLITFNDIKPLDFEMKNKKTCKGVSKVVVDKEINNDDYKNVLNTNSILRKDVISIRSFNHEVFTTLENKVALTSFYDKMRLESPIECVPFGYQGII
jgi:hypothetical protein